MQTNPISRLPANKLQILGQFPRCTNCSWSLLTASNLSAVSAMADAKQCLHDTSSLSLLYVCNQVVLFLAHHLLVHMEAFCKWTQNEIIFHNIKQPGFLCLQMPLQSVVQLQKYCKTTGHIDRKHSLGCTAYLDITDIRTSKTILSISSKIAGQYLRPVNCDQANKAGRQGSKHRSFTSS